MPVARSMVLLLGLVVLLAAGTRPAFALARDAASSCAHDETEDAAQDPAPLALQPDSTGTRYVAPTLEVRGARVTAQRRADRGVGFATVLEASSWSGQARSAADVLGRAVGLHVRDTGGLGGYTTLSVRGSSSAQVPVYLDGVLLNGPGTGEVNLADIELAHLERIEIYRGSAPLTLGGTSLGGAVHLISARGIQPLRLDLSRSTHDTWQGELAGALRASGWNLHLRARGERSEGDWDFLDDRGTLYNPHDDAVRARLNNDVRGTGALLSATRPWRGGELAITEIVDVREQGLPGSSVLQSDTARSHAFTHQARLAWAAPRAWASWLRSVELHHRTEVQGVRDLEGDLGRSPRDRIDRLHLAGTSVGGVFDARGDWRWRVELDWSQLRSTDRARLDGRGAPQTRWSAGLALEPHLRAASDRLLVVPGLRLDHHWQRMHPSPSGGALPGGEVTYGEIITRTAQLGLRYALTDDLAVKANLGAFERAPTLFELFGDRGTAQGNAALLPEAGTNRDLGLVWSRPREGRRFGASVFWNDAFDLITFVRTSPVTAKAFNVGRAEIEGLELEADFGRFGPFGLHATATRMRTRDRTDSAVASGRQLPGRPGYEFELEQSLHLGATSTAFTLLAMGDNYAQTGERAPVPSRVLLGLQTQWRLRDDLALLARVDNLNDVDVFDLWGHPLPQRRLLVAIRAGGNADAR